MSRMYSRAEALLSVDGDAGLVELDLLLLLLLVGVGAGGHVHVHRLDATSL